MTVNQESAVQEKRWIQALEALGPKVVAAKLEGPGTNYGRGADVLGIVDGGPHPPRAFIESWLRPIDTKSQIWRFGRKKPPRKFAWRP